MTSLTALIDRVRTGTGEDRELEVDISIALSIRHGPAPALTTSLDAVVRLAEEKHFTWGVDSYGSAWVMGPDDTPLSDSDVLTDPVRSLLLCLLLALQAQEAEGT